MTTKTSIITSLLDVDFYKLTMGQFVWKNFPSTHVAYELINRHQGTVRIADEIDEDELRDELGAIRELSFCEDEIEYLRSSPAIPDGMFTHEYLEFLAGLTLPEISVKKVDGQYEIRVDGTWKESILWETLILSVINELLTASRARKAGMHGNELFYEGARRLWEKAHRLRGLYIMGAIVEFGTRRRASRAWHEEIVKLLLSWMPSQISGTSNVDLARRYGLRPAGTNAHEMLQAYAALAFASADGANVRASQMEFFDAWYAMYGRKQSIALTDTWGAETFFADFGAERAERWKGLRHDSGDPFEWAARALRFYRDHGIDARQKTLLFSDGLDAGTIAALWRRHQNSARLMFGWGTNLTNDVGLPATSLVVKLVEVDGVPTVKLSDNRAKSLGPPDMVAEYERIFAHTYLTSEPCRY